MMWTFVSIVFVWSIVPGPITMLIINNAWTLNRRAGWMTAFGGCVGIGVYALIGVFLGTLIPDNAPWKTTVEGLGAVYFAFLGMLHVKRSFHHTRHLESSMNDLTTADGQSLINGLLLTCFNPQLALFYWMLVPQADFSSEILSPELVVLSIGLIHFLVRLAWYSVLIILTQPLRGALEKGPMQRSIQLAVGALFLMTGIQILVG